MDTVAGGKMTQTRAAPKPISVFEERIHAAQIGAANLASFIAADAAIRELLLYEAEMSQAGGGAPELYTGIEIHMKWSALDAFSVGDA
jgi:hypothetical protein